MGIFNNNSLDNDLGMITESFMQDYQENLFYLEASMMPEKVRTQLLESTEVKALIEKGLIGRKTMVKLSKLDDLERRTGMAGIQMAKENNDVLYDQLIKNRIKERKLLNAIDRKYASKASRVAKASQKTYIAANPIGSAFQSSIPTLK